MKLSLKYKIIIVLSISFYLLFLFLGAYYFSGNNIYGEYKIAVFDGQKNVTDKFCFSGISFFGQEYILEYEDSFIKGSTVQYFRKFKISFIDSEQTYFGKVEIVIFDSNEDVLEEISIPKVEEGFVYKIYKIYPDTNLILKLKYVNPLIILKNANFQFLIIIFSFFFLLNFIWRYTKINKKVSKIDLKLRLAILVLALLSFVVFVVQVFFLKTIYLFSGVFLFLFVFTTIYQVLSIVIKNDKARINVLTSYTSIAIVLILTEVFLRLFNVNISISEMNNSRYSFLRDNVPKEFQYERDANEIIELKSSEFNYNRTTNSLGFCDIEPTFEKLPEDFLILALGDSFTEGVGSHKDSTWLKFLERRIGNNDSINYRYINAGVSGSDPIAMYVNLKYVLLEYQPDLVITTYGYDLEDIILRGGFERFEDGYSDNLKHSMFSEYLYAFSFVYRLFHHGVLRKNYLFLNEKEYEREKQFAILKLKESIVKYKKLSQEYNFELLLVFYPIQVEVVDRQFMYWDEVIDFAHQEGVMTANLLDYYVNVEMINEANLNDYFWKIDGHNNAKGYEAFGNGVYYALKNYQLID